MTGAAQVLATPTLAALLHLPAPLLAGTGWFLLGYAAVLAFVATRPRLPAGLVWLLVAGNFAWGGACAALLAGDWIAPTGLGTAWILAQAACVLVLAGLQWAGLRRGRAADGASAAHFFLYAVLPGRRLRLASAILLEKALP